ncbi:MAG: alpha-1,4-glucan--maltose-1-phosphate maltosyltransferase [Actinomycetes bacterium]
MAGTKKPTAACRVPSLLTGRFPVLDVLPTVESGRRPAKAVVGEIIPVTATIFREGHDALGADVALYRANATLVQRARMAPLSPGSDRWSAIVRPDTQGEAWFVIEVWDNPLDTWRHRAKIKIPAGQDVELELSAGAALLERALAGLPKGKVRQPIKQAIAALSDNSIPPEHRLAVALADPVWELLGQFPLRDLVCECGPWPLRVERERALFGSWYEFFPRSEGARQRPPKSGTFATASKRLAAIADAGFDVIYLPPIHPIGTAFRKGPNNGLTAAPGDPGSPWAIGSTAGGHDAVHPDLGTLADFVDFVARAKDLGLEVALDFALQVSPDHPWVNDHPEWFVTRADGSIAYAENPPKRYQDIYPINFDVDLAGLLNEAERIIGFWADAGVRIFRVDNPHTKPLTFWDELLRRVATSHPDILFLAEAFTGPAMMRALGEVGFHQSYTYFTWRNQPAEIVEYLTELSGPAASFMRPNLFVNTPDILSDYLQQGGAAAFAIRATLAATLAPTWGMYSGFELYEATALKPGSEEYLDSEKYEYRPRDWTGLESRGKTLTPYLRTLNLIRREQPALQQLRNLVFHPVSGPDVLAYSKQDGDNIVLVVVTTQPRGVRQATVHWDLAALGLQDGFEVVDQLSQNTWTWGSDTYIRLDPLVAVAHIVVVKPVVS